MEVWIIWSSPHEFDGYLVRFDQVSTFRPMNRHLGQRVQRVWIQCEFLLCGRIRKGQHLRPPASEPRIAVIAECKHTPRRSIIWIKQDRVTQKFDALFVRLWIPVQGNAL